MNVYLQKEDIRKHFEIGTEEYRRGMEYNGRSLKDTIKSQVKKEIK